MALKDYGILESLIPSHGGWYFEQDYQGHKQRIPPLGDAGGADKLIMQVRRFRAQNGVELGDYEREIANQIKERSPMNDRWKGKRTSDDLVPPKVTPRRILIARITDWLFLKTQKEVKLVRNDEAKTRAEVCANCRHNVKWQVGCKPCVEEVEQRGKALRQKSGSEFADSLQACRLHDIYLPAAVFLDRSELPSKKADSPAECWLPIANEAR